METSPALATTAPVLAPGLLASAAYNTEASFRALVDCIEDYAIFMLDPKGYIVTWNMGAQKIKGYTADDIIGKHFSAFYTPEAIAREWPQHELREAARHGRLEDEGWRVRKDGTTFWANVIITAVRNEVGELTGFAKVTRDLTVRQRQSEILRRSEERFRLLVDSIQGYGIYMLDCDGEIVSWSAGATQITGYRRDEAIGQHFSFCHQAEDIASGKLERTLAQARAGGKVDDEGWRMRKDGSLFWANVTTTAVHDESGQLRGYAKVIRDMSERKRLEELELANRRMSEFLATLGHELRNPLAPVRNAIGILHLEKDLAPSAQRCRDMIDRQISHLTRLVDDLLDIGRITSGKIGLRMTRLDVRDVVARAIESSRFYTDARGQRIEAALPAAGVRVNGDMTRLVQVVHNLLHNASKFSPAGSVIRVYVERTDRAVRIEVRDPGQGISEHALESIFQLFVQENKAANPTESGLGIGLTLCRSLVHMHGGAISAASAGPDHGSSFTVQLPLAADVAAGPDPASGPAECPVQAKRILVVDDNRDSADSLAMLLQLKGHHTQSLYHANDALRVAEGFKPDVVFIDLAMPRMDGFEALRAFKARSDLKETRFVAMTGYGQEHDRQQTRDAGFDGHLVKPLDMAQLDRVLDQLQT